LIMEEYVIMHIGIRKCFNLKYLLSGGIL